MAEDGRERAQASTLSGWVGGRLARLAITLLAGTGLMFGGFFVLVWGEARVNIATAIERAQDAGDEDVGDQSPVVTTGSVAFDEPAVDPYLKGRYAFVDRRVETCVWVEQEKKQRDGGVTKLYTKRWQSSIPKSDGFEVPGYDNPKAEVLQAHRMLASGLRVQGFAISGLEPDGVIGLSPRTLDPDAVDPAWVARKEWAYPGRQTTCKRDSPDEALIGDQRLSFRVLREGEEITVFGRKDGKSIAPFRGQVLVARGGRDELTTQIKEKRSSRTWTFRAGGALLLWVGLFLLLQPVLGLITWVPVIGGLVQGAVTVLTMLAALVATGGFVWRGWGMTFFTRLFGGLVG